MIKIISVPSYTEQYGPPVMPATLTLSEDSEFPENSVYASLVLPTTVLTFTALTIKVLKDKVPPITVLPITPKDADITVSDHNFACLAENDSNYDEALNSTRPQETQE